MPDRKDKALYLKVSVNQFYTMACIQSWLNLAAIYDAQPYIICEKPEIITEIRKNCILGNMIIEDYADAREKENDPFFIGAYFDSLTDFASRLVAPGWVKATVAHLTTFQHATESVYKSFWNIDADDTFFFTPSATGLKKAFGKAESIAHDYDCASLDMWNSRTDGRHWSFGVACINTSFAWKNIIEQNIELVHTIWKNINLPNRVRNLDWFMTMLIRNKKVNAATFYIDNATFCHYKVGIRKENFPGLGINYWSKNTIVFPAVNYNKPIPDSILKIEVDKHKLPLPPIRKGDPSIDDRQRVLKQVYIGKLNASLKSDNDSFIYTNHDTFLSFDPVENRFYHGNKLIDHVHHTILNDKIFLSYMDKYISFNSTSGRFELVDDPCSFQIVYNNDGTISIKIDSRYLSAWSNGNVIAMPHCLEWERFFI